jgi:hypothetical protein
MRASGKVRLAKAVAEPKITSPRLRGEVDRAKRGG